jgi:signal peptidase I
MGDNRESSMDSRDFGLIDFSHVEGKAVLRIYPFNKFGKIN